MSNVMFVGMESVSPIVPPSLDFQEHQNILTSLAEENHKDAKYSFMCKVIKDCFDEGLLKESVATKVRNKFLAYETSQCLMITSNNKTCQLLGLEETTGAPLTYEEKQTLKQCFFDKLPTYSDYEKKIETIVGGYDSANEPDTTLQNKATLDMRARLESVVEAYAKTVAEQMETLEEIRQLRLENLPKMCERKYQETKLTNSMSERKVRGLNQQVKLNVMMETPVTKNAYSVLMQDIAKQQEWCRNEIEELVELKEKYRAVSCKEYDEILKSYLDCLSLIDALKKIHLNY